MGLQKDGKDQQKPGDRQPMIDGEARRKKLYGAIVRVTEERLGEGRGWRLGRADESQVK